MSTTTWLLLQIWLYGCVTGLLWLLVAWLGGRWERFAQQRRGRSKWRRRTRLQGQQ